MQTRFMRSVLGASAIVASAGILAGGLALRPAFAVGGAAQVGPFSVIHCTSNSPCQTYSNQGKSAGVEGVNTNASFSGEGVLGTGTSGGAGVKGNADNGDGVYGSSTNGYGVSGSSESNYGVAGSSTDSIGVLGDSIDAAGVYAESQGSSSGLYATSTSGYAVEAVSNSATAAIDAVGYDGYAINASTDGGYTELINNTDGNGSDIRGTFIGIVGRAPASTGDYPLVLTDQSGNDLAYVNGGGNMFILGSYGTFAKIRGGGVAAAYTSKVTSPTVEDNGTGRLVNGVAMISLDPTFARAIDASQAYHVMLTPDGDTRGLFVASKSSSGFVVREVQGGRSTIDFDYHIYAPELGQAGVRMTEMTREQAASIMPHAPAPQVPVSKRIALKVQPHH
jgi:hypothetical protein